MPVRQQLYACIMVAFCSEWDDYPISSVPWLPWAGDARSESISNHEIGPFLLIYSNPSKKKLFLKYFICSTFKVNASVV